MAPLWKRPLLASLLLLSTVVFLYLAILQIDPAFISQGQALRSKLLDDPELQSLVTAHPDDVAKNLDRVLPHIVQNMDMEFIVYILQKIADSGMELDPNTIDANDLKELMKIMLQKPTGESSTTKGKNPIMKVVADVFRIAHASKQDPRTMDGGAICQFIDDSIDRKTLEAALRAMQTSHSHDELKKRYTEPTIPSSVTANATFATVSSTSSTTSTSTAARYTPGGDYGAFLMGSRPISTVSVVSGYSRATPSDPPPSGSSNTSSKNYSQVSYTGSLCAAPSITYNTKAGLTLPQVNFVNELGPSTNDPTDQYIETGPYDLITLDKSLLVPGVNSHLTTDYPLSPDTGILEVTPQNRVNLTDLQYKPHISRDGGKGGYLNCQRLFVFCDTGSYGPATDSQPGDFHGFVSSSVAIDKNQHAKYGQPLTLQDDIGEWADDVGRMRGFAPLTGGEQVYNLNMQGNGYRYAVWPESSLIPYNASHAVMYANVVYDVVDKSKGNNWVFTYTGNTLLLVSIPGEGGPRADRLVNKIFDQNEVAWGGIGGIRSWGSSGPGGNDGKVYLFGNVVGGLLLARVDADDITNRGSYEYWTGSSWSPDMPSTKSTAYFITGEFLSADLFYSPYHLSFIFVYLTPWADNTFYYRFLNVSEPIVPSYDTRNYVDILEQLVDSKNEWSNETVLYKAQPGPTGRYIYGGGPQLGYFDEDDVTNGGTNMLLTWSVPTGGDPALPAGEYQLNSAVVDWK
ncbi:hypothetical protein NA57DRAFT_71337 [Rhizodiscina lignyota]|uniref:DUF4185 domain-containing protein n=1 Tax=Rhizodiscina lignyota TaxID=1504668 RepID=A0A9P4IP92_9PEZI|nr:hypothetical protein NA57DRAFT_71337 [Rhizodiscina lignyota]